MATQFELLKRVKGFNPFESSISVVGSFLFYSDLGSVNLNGALRAPATATWLWGCCTSTNVSAVEPSDLGIGEVVNPVEHLPPLKDGFLDCDFFDGKWVWDDTYPLYSSRDCKFLDSGFRCSENGRPDSLYTKWRWQPNRCNLPRFDAKLILEKLRNRRIAFVDDSIGRNQWESLLCMLASAIRDRSSIYEVNGSPITKHTRFLVFLFRDYNCTVDYYRSPFLVVQGRPPSSAPQNVKMTLKVDQLDWSSWQWKDADVLVFNSGHWWNHEKTIRIRVATFKKGQR